MSLFDHGMERIDENALAWSSVIAHNVQTQAAKRFLAVDDEAAFLATDPQNKSGTLVLRDDDASLRFFGATTPSLVFPVVLARQVRGEILVSPVDLAPESRVLVVAGAVTEVDLPAPSNAIGLPFSIRNLGASAVDINASLDGSANPFSLGIGEVVEIVSDSISWHILSLL